LNGEEYGQLQQQKSGERGEESSRATSIKKIKEASLISTASQIPGRGL
jgi:hypothetical protein